MTNKISLMQEDPERILLQMQQGRAERFQRARNARLLTTVALLLTVAARCGASGSESSDTSTGSQDAGTPASTTITPKATTTLPPATAAGGEASTTVPATPAPTESSAAAIVPTIQIPTKRTEFDEGTLLISGDTMLVRGSEWSTYSLVDGALLGTGAVGGDSDGSGGEWLLADGVAVTDGTTLSVLTVSGSLEFSVPTAALEPFDVAEVGGSIEFGVIPTTQHLLHGHTGAIVQEVRQPVQLWPIDASHAVLTDETTTKAVSLPDLTVQWEQPVAASHVRDGAVILDQVTTVEGVTGTPVASNATVEAAFASACPGGYLDGIRRGANFAVVVGDCAGDGEHGLFLFDKVSGVPTAQVALGDDEPAAIAAGSQWIAVGSDDDTGVVQIFRVG